MTLPSNILRPSCGHSICSQVYIDTGDPRCCALPCEACSGDPEGCGACYGSGIASYRSFALDSDRVGTALAIRAACPWIGLSDALTYADASTVQGKAFRSRSGFCGLGFSRDAFAFGLAWYAQLWAPVGGRLARIWRSFGVTLGVCARLESEDTEAKRAYGAIVRSEAVPALIVAWERFAKRARAHGIAIPYWPGICGMAPIDPKGEPLPIPCYSWEASEENTIRGWFRSIGFAPEAIESFAPRGDDAARAHMRVMLASAPEVQR